MYASFACAHSPATASASLPGDDLRSNHTNRLLDAREALRLLNHSKSPLQTKQIHAQIIRAANLSADPTLLSNLLRRYSSHRRLDLASLVFSHFPNTIPPPTFAWNLFIRAHTANSSPSHALLLFHRMLLLSPPAPLPDKFTFPFVIKACALLSHLQKGTEVHALAIKSGFSNDLFLQNTLIHFYFACRRPDCGRKVFDKMRTRTVVSWTALVSGLVACGDLNAALHVFETMPLDRNVVTWTAMIDGFARNGRPEEAFVMFRRMIENNVRPNEFTLVGLLIACTEIGSLGLGRWVHEFAHKNGELERGVYVGTALIDMYSKCGSLEDAVRVFDQMPVRSLATWNSMITSSGVHGFGREVFDLFTGMEKEGMRPDGITLVGVLSACVRKGMVEDGWRLFGYMREKYGVEPGIEHYRCLVDLLNCSEETRMVEDLVMELNGEEQRLLLLACRARGNTEIEEVVCSCMEESKTMEVGVGSLVCR